MSRWLPALRMARRDLWRHRGRAVLTMFLVALPVLVGVTVAQFHHNTRWDGERAARSSIGAADALVEVTPFERARVTYWPAGMHAQPGAFTRDDGNPRKPVRRDPSSVDLEAMLPQGSRLIPALEYHVVTLATGGVGHVKIIDASDPMAEGLVSVSAGVPPTKPDEVALAETPAEELGLLDTDGSPRPDATMRLLDGTTLRIVGVLEYNTDSSPDDGFEMLAAPGSIVAGLPESSGDERFAPRYLVDLPDSVGPAPHRLARMLASHGVAMLPRDLMFHPDAWRVQAVPKRLAAASLAIGALIVMFGLIEVVLIVGSAIAVGARRQVRDLGLVAASGGAPADVRRVLLAQGLVLGASAAVLGAVTGVLAFRAGTPVYEQLMHQRIWTHEIDWLSVVGVTVLGGLTGVTAALVPAWSIGRLTPVAALSGRFPIRNGESRAHRPGFILAGAGMIVLLLSGWWTAAEYAPPPASVSAVSEFAHQPSPVPVVVGGFGILMLIGGVVWTAPYTVRRIAALGRLLPLSGRFALRDAARHRFRTAAAAVTLTVTVAGAVFAGFAAQAVAQSMGQDSQPLHTISIHLDEQEAAGQPPSERVDKVVATIHDVVGPAETLVTSRLSRPGKAHSELMVRGPGGLYVPVRLVDEETLRRLVGSGDALAVRSFRGGAVVTTARRAVREGHATVAVDPGARKPGNRWTLPAVVVQRSDATAGTQSLSAWVSQGTARRMGLVTVPVTITVLADRAVTSDDITRLAVHGIIGRSPDTDLEALGNIQLAATGAVGLFTLLVVGIAVALSAAEGRADQATMTAVGAGPLRRRALGAMHGLFLGVVGALLGVLVGVPAGAALMQVDGAPGVAVPWQNTVSLLLVVPLLAWAAGWLVTSTRLTLVRRAG